MKGSCNDYGHDQPSITPSHKHQRFRGGMPGGVGNAGEAILMSDFHKQPNKETRRVRNEWLKMNAP